MAKFSSLAIATTIPRASRAVSVWVRFNLYDLSEYHNSRVSATTFNDVDGADRFGDVTNTGKMAGKEVCKCMSTISSQFGTPYQRAKGFAKVKVWNRAKTKTVSVHLEFTGLRVYTSGPSQWIRKAVIRYSVWVIVC